MSSRELTPRIKRTIPVFKAGLLALKILSDSWTKRALLCLKLVSKLMTASYFFNKNNRLTDSSVLKDHEY